MGRPGGSAFFAGKHVEDDGACEYASADHVLVGDPYSEKVHAACKGGHDDGTDDGACHFPYSSGTGYTADVGRGDGIKLEQGPGRRGGRLEPGGEEDSRQGGKHPHGTEHDIRDFLDVDPAQVSRFRIASDGVDVAPEDGFRR